MSDWNSGKARVLLPALQQAGWKIAETDEQFIAAVLDAYDNYLIAHNMFIVRALTPPVVKEEDRRIRGPTK